MAAKQPVGLGEESGGGKMVDRADRTKVICGPKVDKDFHSTDLSQSFYRYTCPHEVK